MTRKRRTLPDYKVSTVDRALNVLEAFTAARPELTLTEVAELAGLPAPTALRLLATLTRRGMLNRSQSRGHYRLGPRLVALAGIARTTDAIPLGARAVLRQLRDLLEETTYLSVRAGDLRIDVEQAEGLLDVRRVITLGRPIPLHIGCPGKVLMAGMSEKELADYLQRIPLGKDRYGNVIDRAELETEIRRIRRIGYAETRHRQGAGAISAPIRGPSGDTVAALTVSVPFARYSRALREKILQATIEAARSATEDAHPQPAMRLRTRR